MTDLPDFHIPHLEKIEWMIETHGWAMEPVDADISGDVPRGGYVYTIGYPEAFGFPDVVVFGLTPSAARGLFDMLADLLRGGTDIPLGVELTGMFDNDLRCVFAPIDDELLPAWFPTGWKWRRGTPSTVVQLLWPDRNGFLPHEAGFDRKLRFAQPVIGHLAG
jgi:Domain of unknown function (DUF4262)